MFKIVAAWPLKNKKSEEQLSLTTLLILVIFKRLYLVKMFPILDGSPILLFTRYENFLSGC